MDLRRSIIRLVITGALTAMAFASSAAVGQVGDSPEPVAQVSSDAAVDLPAGDVADGGSVTTTDEGLTQARLGSTSVDAVTTSCPDSDRWETDLGLMARMHLQSHCDFP